MDRINEYGIEPGAYSGPSGVVTVVAVVAKVESCSNVTLLSDPMVLYRDSQIIYGGLIMISKSEFILHYKLV